MAWTESALPSEVERVAASVRHAASMVHREVGPGFREATYQTCLAHALHLAGHDVEQYVPVTVEFRGLRIPGAAEVDLVVDHLLIVELKAREAFHSSHVLRP